MDDKEKNFDTWISDSQSGIDTITLSDMSTITMNSGLDLSTTITIGPAITGAGSNGIYSVSPNTWHQNDLVFSDSTNGSGQLKLSGNDADIDINGVSLMETLRGLQDRLNILRPAPELEAEWTELKELGERYRKLEAELKEKTQMWDTLKKMPPPEIE